MSYFPTAPIAAAGLIAGFAVADATGNRPSAELSSRQVESPALGHGTASPGR